MKDWVNIAVAGVLRAGVVISIVLVATGMVMTFVAHPEYFSSRPALGSLTSPNAHFPNTLVDVTAGVRHGSGEAIVMAGLLVLIATPVARVALSVFVFAVARDRLYVALTVAVLLILLVSFWIGLAEA